MCEVTNQVCTLDFHDFRKDVCPDLSTVYRGERIAFDN